MKVDLTNAEAVLEWAKHEHGVYREPPDYETAAYIAECVKIAESVRRCMFNGGMSYRDSALLDARIEELEWAMDHACYAEEGYESLEHRLAELKTKKVGE